MPQIGAVLVPINFRLSAEEFQYLIQHSGATVVCVDADYLEAVDSIRPALTGVRHFVALDRRRRDGWLDYERLVAETATEPDRPAIDERDLLTINYTSGTTSRPKGVMITHRNAWVNVMGMLVHMPMTAGERYLWTLPMFHANGWTYTWTSRPSAAGTCVSAKSIRAAVFRLTAEEGITLLCAAPTVLIALANAPDGSEGRRAARRAGVHRRRAAGGGHDPTRRGGPRLDSEPALRPHRNLAGHHHLRAAARTRDAPSDRAGAAKARQGVELISVRRVRVVDRCLGPGSARRWRDPGRDRRARQRGHGRLLQRSRCHRRRRWATAGSTRGDAAVVHPDGYVEIRDRLKDVIISGGENISSVEVEATLLRHDAVQEVAVVGMPDGKWGEAPHAFVVFRPGAEASDEALRAFCRERLAHFKVPHSFTPVGELPEDGDRQDSEVRAAQRPAQHLGAVKWRTALPVRAMPEPWAAGSWRLRATDSARSQSPHRRSCAARQPCRCLGRRRCPPLPRQRHRVEGRRRRWR